MDKRFAILDAQGAVVSVQIWENAPAGAVESDIANIGDIYGDGKFSPAVAEDVPAAEHASQDRATAYRNEADPLFFKEQRGEVEIGTWLAKVDEIKARYPK